MLSVCMQLLLEKAPRVRSFSLSTGKSTRAVYVYGKRKALALRPLCWCRLSQSREHIDRGTAAHTCSSLLPGTQPASSPSCPPSVPAESIHKKPQKVAVVFCTGAASSPGKHSLGEQMAPLGGLEPLPAHPPLPTVTSRPQVTVSSWCPSALLSAEPDSGCGSTHQQQGYPCPPGPHHPCW